MLGALLSVKQFQSDAAAEEDTWQELLRELKGAPILAASPAEDPIQPRLTDVEATSAEEDAEMPSERLRRPNRRMIRRAPARRQAKARQRPGGKAQQAADKGAVSGSGEGEAEPPTEAEMGVKGRKRKKISDEDATSTAAEASAGAAKWAPRRKNRIGSTTRVRLGPWISLPLTHKRCVALQP